MSATGPTAVTFNPFEPGFLDDPYHQYRRLREQDPVHRSPLEAWILFRHDDVFTLLRDSSLSVDDANATPTLRAQQLSELIGDQPERGQRAILNIDPPDHTRLRRLVSKAFTPRMMERLRPRVAQLVGEALDRVAPTGEMELVTDLAFPLPFTVISELLGMPDGRRDELRSWSHTLTKTLDPVFTDDEVQAALAASDCMRDHVLDVLAWKRREPADDVLTGLLAAEDHGDVLTEDELLDQVVLLYIAGHETTVNLIANGTLALVRHRAQLERLASDPSLVANATEELLRYDSPVQFSRRITTADVEIGGVAVDAGQFVLTCLGSANRDPAKWGADADRLDLARPGAAQHVSFGSGIHHCLGAALARVEAQEAFGGLVGRFPRLDLAGEPVGNGRIVLRGLDQLPLRLDGPSGSVGA